MNPPATTLRNILAPPTGSRWFVVSALLRGSAPPLLLAVGCGWLTPRGPVTGTQAVVALITALVAGLLSGWLMRSRWAMALAPFTFAVVFELVRMRVQGPTVDMPRGLDGIYGWLAAASGRGVHAVLALVPLSLGAAWGAGAVRRRGSVTARGRSGRYFRRVVASVATLALIAAGVTVAQPRSTEPIQGADGLPRAGSVAEITHVTAGDHSLSLLIRGNDVTNPVLLYLAGGPGGSELGAMRRHGQGLEENFVVATLDQRGTGTSYDQIDPIETHTLEAAVDDVVSVTTYLTTRFGHDRVYLVGQSWGTILGILAARDHPELYAAFVGVGQMVDPFETDGIFYNDTLAWARQTGDTALAAKLEKIGPPPYEDLLDLSVVLGAEQDVYPYDHTVNAEGAGQMLENLPVTEYGLIDTVNIVRGLLDTISVLYPQLKDVDLRVDAPRLAIPVYLAEGRYEPRGRADLAAEWLAALDAPEKQWVEFTTSGHRPIFEEPDAFLDLMTRIAHQHSTTGR